MRTWTFFWDTWTSLSIVICDIITFACFTFISKLNQLPGNRHSTYWIATCVNSIRTYSLGWSWRTTMSYSYLRILDTTKCIVSSIAGSFLAYFARITLDISTGNFPTSSVLADIARTTYRIWSTKRIYTFSTLTYLFILATGIACAWWSWWGDNIRIAISLEATCTLRALYKITWTASFIHSYYIRITTSLAGVSEIFPLIAATYFNVTTVLRYRCWCGDLDFGRTIQIGWICTSWYTKPLRKSWNLILISRALRVYSSNSENSNHE